MKKIIKLFCIVSCLMVCFSGCGKKDQGISYKAEDVRAYMEQQITNVSNDTEEAVEDIKNAPFYTEDGVFDTSVSSWNTLNEDCGTFNGSVSNFEINESNGELTVTENMVFDKREVIVTSTFEEENDSLVMTSLSFDPVYSLGEKLEQAAMNTLMGMGTVFLVLIFISLVISLFKFIPAITEYFENRNKETIKEETADKPVESAPVIEEVLTDDTELIAVIAAAIAASENTTTDGFVVRSIRRR